MAGGLAGQEMPEGSSCDLICPDKSKKVSYKNNKKISCSHQLFLQAGLKVATLYCLNDQFKNKSWLEKDGKKIFKIPSCKVCF